MFIMENNKITILVTFSGARETTITEHSVWSHDVLMNRGALCAPKDAFSLIFAFTKL